jgi:hypothetical protein
MSGKFIIAAASLLISFSSLASTSTSEQLNNSEVVAASPCKGIAEGQKATIKGQDEQSVTLVCHHLLQHA